jgi:hypothetical protein
MKGMPNLHQMIEERLPQLETCAVDFFPSQQNYLDRDWQYLGRGKSE